MAKRRGKGEGSVFQRKTGRQAGKWISVVDYGYINGKQVRKYYYSDTFKEAQAKLKAGLREKESGLLPDNQTVEGYLTAWADEVARPSLAASTVNNYIYHIENRINPKLGKHKLQELTPQHVQNFINSELKEGKSPSYTQKSRAILIVALNHALRWGLVTRNVAALTDPPKLQRQEQRALTREQARTFLDAIKGDPLETLFMLSLCLGLRRGEVLGLQWSDFDAASGSLSVRRSVQRIEGKLRLTDVKTARSHRRIVLPDFLVAALFSRGLQQKEQMRRAGRRWRTTDLIFTTRTGTPLEPRNVNRSFTRLLAKAGLEDFRVHDMRHSAASLLLAAGMSLQAVSRLLGHSSTKVTGDVYTHIYEDEMREIADEMGRIFGER